MRLFILLSLMLIFLPACGLLTPRPSRPQRRELETCLRTFRPINEAQGWASWYGKEFQGRPTASGERYDMYALTAAHRSFPLGSQVRIQNLCSNQAVTVTINDRGPASRHRLIDVSYSAARALGMILSGVLPVEIRLLKGL